MQIMVRRLVKTFLSTLALSMLMPPVGAAQSGTATKDTLSPELFVRVSDERFRAVMHIGPGSTPGSMLVLTTHDAQEFDPAGKRVRMSGFPNELSMPFTARFSSTGPQRIIGLKSGFFSSWVDVLDDSANRLAKLKGSQYATLEVADVLGDAAKEVLVEYNDGVAVLNETGRRIAFIRSPRYLYHFRTIQLPDSPKRAIAMWMWIDAKRGVDVAVFKADSARVAAWHEDHAERRVNVISLGGAEGEGLWSAVNGRFIERTITGAVRRTFDMPGMMRFRHMHGGGLGGGRKVLVGSMGTVGSLVCVFDAAGVLIGQSTLPVLTHAFYVPDPNGQVFFVGNGDKVLRYDVSSVPGSAALP